MERLRAAGVQGALLDLADARAMEPELTGELAGASFFPPTCSARRAPSPARWPARLPRVHTGVEVHGVAVEHDRVTGLRTSEGVLACDAAVIAAGPWSRALAEAAGVALPLEPRKGQLVRLAAAPRDERFIRHKVVEAGYLGSVASVEAGLQVTTVLETTWEGDVLVGSSRERRGFDLSVDDAVSARHARAGLRAHARPARRSRSTPPGPGCGRGCPITCRHRTVERRRRGCGWPPGTRAPAWRSAPSPARLVAQLYAGEAPIVDPAPFSPDRF